MAWSLRLSRTGPNSHRVVPCSCWTKSPTHGIGHRVYSLAFISTTACPHRHRACSAMMPVLPRRARPHTHLIIAVASSAGTAPLGQSMCPIARDSAASQWGPRNCPPAASLLHRDRTIRSRCVLLHLPALLGFTERACCNHTF